MRGMTDHALCALPSHPPCSLRPALLHYRHESLTHSALCTVAKAPSPSSSPITSARGCTNRLPRSSCCKEKTSVGVSLGTQQTQGEDVQSAQSGGLFSGMCGRQHLKFQPQCRLQNAWEDVQGTLISMFLQRGNSAPLYPVQHWPTHCCSC